MKPTVNSFTWKIGGQAGDGIMVTGAMLSKICTRAGLWVTDYSEYPSLIRGGHNAQVVQVDAEQIFAHDQGIEILVALNEETVRLHTKELSPGGVILHDPDKLVINGAMLGDRNDVQVIGVPFLKIANNLGGKDIMRNTVALGATLGLLRAPKDLIAGVMQDTFSGKGEAVVKMNEDICMAGYQHVVDHMQEPFGWSIQAQQLPPRMVMTGNDAIALGLLQGGLKFYAAYPMTPASSILTGLAELASTYGIVVRHAEDEISAVNLAIGASYAGARAATGTSGGGFCLMTEGVGLAAEAEVPLVIINAMRPGPSTGLPTWTEQGDLRLVMHASQGDFPRIVVAPGDVTQAFQESARALQIAEAYHLQVTILTDKYLAESHWSTPGFALDQLQPSRVGFADPTMLKGMDTYQRYTDTANGVTPRSIPGQPGGVHTANSDEHDVIGHADETSEMRVLQVQKRERKLVAALEAMPPRVLLYGEADADITLVTWGSATLSCREAMRKLTRMGIRVNIMQTLYILPFPVEDLQGYFRAAKKTVLVENNFSGQFGGVLREYTGLVCNHQLLKYDGRPFWPEEIVDFVKGIV